MTTVGFLGVGTISTALIRGLRQQWPDLHVHVSPRSEAVSRALAESDRLISRHASNAAVVKSSDIVFLSMLPPQLDAAVRGLPFRRKQIVVSLVGGAPLADVEALVAPASTCRIVPVPTIARREGPIVLYKVPPTLRTLLEGLGDLFEAEDEAIYQAYVSCSWFMSTYFRLQTAMVDEIERQGAPRAGATAYVGSLLRALAETSVRADPASLASLPSLHETPGGFNQRIRLHLERQGWFGEISIAFQSIASLRRNDLKVGPEG
jgi:pyrroline-5-carboxylate reductase